ncbi:MAG TPA: NAD(P)/FAD-dependent oxidoreductase [Vicinamibacteria bacterium]|nr:NAD(P)/FAD-dependent oxidoreductase [Vicinamibacteria bacterium]
MADTPLTIVGAGVVGLAVAARLAPRFPEAVVLERRERHGTETSSRNSEVIHAGMYYPTGTLKARLCVRGNRLLYELCERLEVPHRRTTKLIVATAPGEAGDIERLLALGRANGVPLSMLTGEECRRLEPAVAATVGLLSPTTGIVSAHGLMDALLHEARRHGAILQPRAELVGLERRDGDYRLEIRTPDGVESLTSERVVNAAGLGSDTVAALAGIDVEAAGYRLHWWKGSYFAVSGPKARLVSRLVYPPPTHVSLGIHAILGLDGRLRFGPDADHLPDRRQDYSVDETKRAGFGAAVRQLFPQIADEDLAPDIAGIRAKLQGPGEGFRDFVIAEESARGRPGLVSLVGIDSPGLTSALAIAEEVERLLPA